MSGKIMAFGYGCICSDIKLKVYVVKAENEEKKVR